MTTQAQQLEGVESGGIWPSIRNLVRDFRELLIILSAFAALGMLTAFTVGHYDAQEDAVGVLGVVIPAITAIASLAFGVGIGASVGGEVNKADKQAAQRKLIEKSNSAAQLKPEVDDLRRSLTSILAAIEQAPSAPGVRSFQLQPGAEIALDDVESVRERLTRIEVGIERILA